MNVFDFDKTIYDGDSTLDFYLFSLRHHPKIARRILKLFVDGLLFVFKRIEKTVFKERMYAFLRDLPKDQDYVLRFWDAHFHKIKPWYMAMKTPSDVVISASPEFLLRPACARLEIQSPIASRVSQSTGAYDGVNCYGEEKVSRFYEAYPGAEIDSFYSDSYSDSPLANLARESFLVSGDILSKWNTKGID